MNSDVELYRRFTYPLNVFMLIVSAEEGAVRYLHYGFFESASESLGEAQERSTRMLFERLRPPPCKILEVGIGLATTLRRLTDAGYDAEGITPDEHQIEMVRHLHGEAVRVTCSAFETFEARAAYDLLLFQESSQYIDADVLFSRAGELAPHVLVIDEFSLVPGMTDGLPELKTFEAMATKHGFQRTEEVDVSAMAGPTVNWFMERIPGYRDRLVAELGVTDEQIGQLLESGMRYRSRYESGSYGYRILQYRRS
jgi:hypothetical protein